MTQHIIDAAEQWIRENPNEEKESRLLLASFLERTHLYEGIEPEEQLKRLINHFKFGLCLYTRSLPPLAMSSPRFNPFAVKIDSLWSRGGADLWKTQFKAALPDAAKAIMESTSPQEPIVFITRGRVSLWPNISAMFLHYDDDCEDGRATIYEAGQGMGEDILSHVTTCWCYTGEDGRPLYLDKAYRPSCKVMEFSAVSPVHAYFRVITAIADGGDWEAVSGACLDLAPWTDTTRFDPEDVDDDAIEECRHIDYETNCLFLHIGEDDAVHVATIRFRDLVDDARQWVMGATI